MFRVASGIQVGLRPAPPATRLPWTAQPVCFNALPGDSPGTQCGYPFPGLSAISVKFLGLSESLFILERIRGRQETKRENDFFCL